MMHKSLSANLREFESLHNLELSELRRRQLAIGLPPETDPLIRLMRGDSLARAWQRLLERDDRWPHEVNLLLHEIGNSLSQPFPTFTKDCDDADDSSDL